MILSPTEGVGNAGCPMHPQPRVRNGSEHTSVATEGPPEYPGIPAPNGFNGFFPPLPAVPPAIVLTAYFVPSPATNSSCHRHRRIKACLRPVGPTCLHQLDTSNG